MRSQKIGRVRNCQLETQALRAAERWISERRTLWERRFDRLGAFLAEQATETEEGMAHDGAIDRPCQLRDRASL